MEVSPYPLLPIKMSISIINRSKQWGFKWVLVKNIVLLWKNITGTATALNRNLGEDTDLGTLIAYPPLSLFLYS